MDIEGNLSLEEAKRVACQKGAAPIGEVQSALDVLYVELRKLEDQRDQHLFKHDAPDAAEAA